MSSHNRSLLADIWAFLKERKAWWLTPLVILFVIVAAFIFLAHSSVISPFIYALF